MTFILLSHNNIVLVHNNYCTIEGKCYQEFDIILISKQLGHIDNRVMFADCLSCFLYTRQWHSHARMAPPSEHTSRQFTVAALKRSCSHKQKIHQLAITSHTWEWKYRSERWSITQGGHPAPMLSYLCFIHVCTRLGGLQVAEMHVRWWQVAI